MSTPSAHRSARFVWALHVIPPIASAIVLGAIGAFSLWAKEVWLIPSLGSAIFLQAMTPQEESAHPWNVSVGQLCGAACGFIGDWVTGAGGDTSFMGNHHLASARVLSAVIAVFFTIILQHSLKATCAAGGATALIVALGAETATLDGAIRLTIGVLLITAMGEVVRRFMLRMR